MRLRQVVASALALLVTGAQGQALNWTFEQPIAVTAASGPGIFHHIESAGRSNIAIAEGSVAVIWEDNRGGTPAVYAALRRSSGPFTDAIRLSGDGEAFEPVILSYEGGFVAAWEEDGDIIARTLSAEGKAGTPAKVATNNATQVTLAAGPKGIAYAFWSQQEADGVYRIRSREISGRQDALAVGEAITVDIRPVHGDQSYPAAAWHDKLGAMLVAWEDRRTHNVALRSAIGGIQHGFTSPVQVNGLWPPMSRTYGVSTGAARISLRPIPEGVIAAWADKRNFRNGYDIYAAAATHDGRFGDNQLVQDGFGDGFEQWHAAVAANKEAVIVAWDDNRDGTSDIWMAQRAASGWSDDMPTPASGPGHQAMPGLLLDASSNLHLIWVHRDEDGSPTTLMYAVAKPSAE